MPTESPALEESFYEADAVRWTRWLPWLHLFRSVWFAVDLRKLLLAAVALLVWAGGVGLLEKLPFYAFGERLSDGFVATQVTPLGAVSAGSVASGVTDPLKELFSGPPTGARIGTAALLVVWSLLLWAVFGGAIARLTALQFSDDHPSSLPGALKYSARRVLTCASGPLLPLSAVVVIGAALALGGWVSRIPAVGDVVAAALWWLALVLALLAALLLIGMSLAWPLMVTTIAAEGTDSFDALSRAFSYITQRFWYAAALVTLAIGLGAFGEFVVDRVGAMTLLLVDWFVAASGSDFAVDAGTSSTMSHSLAGLTERGFASLVAAFMTSYFWTATTLIYFLLRKAVDATPLEHIYIPTSEGADTDPPVVGMASADAREETSAEEEASEDTEDAPAPV